MPDHSHSVAASSNDPLSAFPTVAGITRTLSNWAPVAWTATTPVVLWSVEPSRGTMVTVERSWARACALVIVVVVGRTVVAVATVGAAVLRTTSKATANTTRATNPPATTTSARPAAFSRLPGPAPAAGPRPSLGQGYRSRRS